MQNNHHPFESDWSLNVLLYTSNSLCENQLVQRFWDKVEKTEDCWNWMAGLRAGYGAFKYKRKVYGAHQFVWFLIYGKLSKQWILHRCNNRRCVNPAHIYEGSPKQNYWDMRKNGNAHIPQQKYQTEEQKKQYYLENKRKNLERYHKRGKYQRWYRQGKIEKEDIPL